MTEHVSEQHRVYTILGVVGEGGFGRVYRARLTDQDFSKDVAIKMLHDRDPPPELLARFRDEARILALVRDRAVVSVEPPIQLADRWAVVMDFVDGMSLGQAVRKLGRLPPAVGLEIVAEVARALHKAYTYPGPDGKPLKLVHRDVKPANIQITPSGEVRLLDFGTAVADFAYREAEDVSDIAGTPGYIAPERMEGVDGPAGDVYGLGVTLWCALLAESPGKRRGQVLSEILDEVAERDAGRRLVLELAIEMRNPDPEARPTPEEVRDRAKDLLRALPGPFLHEWASQIPHRGMEEDRLTGQQLTVTLQDAQDTGSVTPTVRRGLMYGTGLGLGVMGTVGAAVLGVAIGLIGVIGVKMSSGSDPAPPDPIVPVESKSDPEPEPEPTTAPPIPEGSEALRFHSGPPGATVLIDGQAIGVTPLEHVVLPHGPHTLEMRKGLLTVSTDFEVTEHGPSTWTWSVTQGEAGLRAQ